MSKVNFLLFLLEIILSRFRTLFIYKSIVNTIDIQRHYKCTNEYIKMYTMLLNKSQGNNKSIPFTLKDSPLLYVVQFVDAISHSTMLILTIYPLVLEIGVLCGK